MLDVTLKLVVIAGVLVFIAGALPGVVLTYGILL